MSDSVSIEATFRDSDGGQVSLRTVGLGLQPIILIEPIVEDDNITFSIDATDIDRDGLVEMLELLANGLRGAGGDE